MLSFILFKYYNSDWLDINSRQILAADSDQKIKKIAGDLSGLKKMVEAQMAHPLAKQLDKIVRRYSLYFSLLSETIEQDPAKAYAEAQKGEKHFFALVNKVCNAKYKTAKKWK